MRLNIQTRSGAERSSPSTENRSEHDGADRFLVGLGSIRGILLHSPTSDRGVLGSGKVGEKKRCGRLVLKGIGDILDIENFHKISM